MTSSRSVIVGLALIATILTGGCFGPAVTTITSSPAGAGIIVNGRDLGVTPLTTKVKQGVGIGYTYRFTATKPGYCPETKTFEERFLGATVKGVIPPEMHFELRPQLPGVTIHSEKSMPEADHGASADAKDVGSRWAVIIGVSRYRDSRIPGLRYASADARAFHDWAVSPNGGKYAPAKVMLLLDQQATGKALKDALFGWLKGALEEDFVTVYFAGHGSPESPDSPDNLFLLPFDAEYDSIPSTGFPMWDIETALKRYIKAKRVVVIADACHSGGVGQSFDIARRANRGLKVNPISTGIQSLTKVGEGVCVISASDENQYSQESKDWGGGHGVFTYFLLKGLNGDADFNEDTSVTLGELTSYLSQEVRRATKNAQSPTVAGRYDPALTIGK